MLENEQPIPEENKPHMLSGDYAGCMECHIQSDFLLIWIDPDTDEIDLVRLGTHSELFGKGNKRQSNINADAPNVFIRGLNLPVYGILT